MLFYGKAQQTTNSAHFDMFSLDLKTFKFIYSTTIILGNKQARK